jgi:hypothetical protein
MIDHFVFAPAAQHYGFVLRFLFGTMQYLSGLTTKLSPDSMVIKAPTATIGVRGTRFLAGAESSRFRGGEGEHSSAPRRR